MFVIYIDDSFFGTSDFSRDMRYKLRVLLNESPLDHVWISNARTNSETIERFFKEFEDISYTESTVRFVQDQKEWGLTNTSLQCEDVCIRPFSGTYCLVDTKTLQYERIYLDLFPQEETDLATIFSEAIQDALRKISGSKEKMKS